MPLMLCSMAQLGSYADATRADQNDRVIVAVDYEKPPPERVGDCLQLHAIAGNENVTRTSDVVNY
jgi:hypothetical protein